MLDKIIDYVFEEWGIQPVLKLEHEINCLVKALAKNKKLCPKSQILNIRKCVVMEQISLIYKIESSNLEIVTFIDNRSKHNY
jgi:plasmid stabilization system protein ParE